MEKSKRKRLRSGGELSCLKSIKLRRRSIIRRRSLRGDLGSSKEDDSPESSYCVESVRNGDGEGGGRDDGVSVDDIIESDSDRPVCEDDKDNISDEGTPGTPVVHENVVKTKIPRIQGLYKPPTHEELQTLKETQNLFKSNLMKLQITELLGEIKPKKNTESGRKLEELLHEIKKTLLSLPSSSQINLSEGLSLLSDKIKYPLHFTPSTSKGKFRFSPPSEVKVVGSYLLGTMTKPGLNVDIELSLPADCLQVKDMLNYRYFHKRALYLSIMAGHLKKRKKTLSLKSIVFESLGNPLLPVLSLVPEGKHLSKYSIRLHTSIPNPTYFKLSKLTPDHNNVRRSFLLTHTSSNLQQNDESDVGPPTPHYNGVLLVEQGARGRHLKELYLSAQECPGFVDAVVLYKIWAHQRKLDKGFGGFTGFHFSMLVSALISQKRINHLMSCYQIFRVALQQLTVSDWTKKGFVYLVSPSKPSLIAFHSAHDVVFLDSSGLLNLCADISHGKYHWLKHEAALALELLDEPTTHGFEALFMRSVPLEQKFDNLYHIPLNSLSQLPDNLEPAIKERFFLDMYVWLLPLLLSFIWPVLCRGLEKRVKLIVPFIQTQHRETLQWPLSKPPPDPNSGHVILGLLLDTDHAFSILNMGPSADSSEADEFRSFWGERSELRRFQDGSINEAVVWEGEGSDVCQQIIKHLFHRHFSIPLDCVTSNNNLMDPLLSNCTFSKKQGESAMQNVQDVFMELSRDLRRLKDLPLFITSLQGTSPTFRYTEVFPLKPWNGRLSSKLQATPPVDCQSNCYYPSCESATPPFVPVHPVICQLESSGKWPDEVEAIRQVKVAFYVHIAKALKKEKGLVASPTKDFLDIYKSGYVFRLKLHHHRELVLLKEGRSRSGPKQPKEESAAMYKTMVALPVLTSTLNGLYQQFPAFGNGTRLCKRWVASHLMSNHLSDEAIELMVAHLFTNPAPFTPPSTDLLVVIRFLSLLSTYDWEDEPLVVNFNKELSDTQISGLKSDFSKSRPSLPSLVIITPHDQWPSSPWTSNSSPSVPVFHRLQQLAREALNVVSKLILTGGDDIKDVKQIFRTPLQDFNVLIYLNKKHLPHSSQAVDAKESPSKHKPNWSHKCTHLPVVDFDPVQIFLRELEGAFSDFALFFYDKYGGSFIAVLWKPHAFTTQSFKVGKAHCRIPAQQGDSKERSLGLNSKHSEGKNLVVPDVESIIADFQIIGEGLVKNIEILTTPSSGHKNISIIY